MNVFRFGTPLLLVALAGCATPHVEMHAPAPATAARSEQVPTTRPAATKRARRGSMITREELSESHYPDAFAAVEALRPSWLRQRGSSSFSRPEYIKAYHDGMPLGSVAGLRRVATDEILSIQWLNGSDATQRFGTDNGSGAILVTTRR